MPAWLRYGAVAAGTALAVWVVQSWRYEARIARMEQTWAQERAELAEAARHAEAAARAEEHRRQAEIERITQDAQAELDAALRRERAAADSRVRSAVADYAARHQCPADSGSAGSGEATGDPIGVLAELLGELDGLAESYAAAADRARVAGLACERAYDSVTE